jgi:hypothetical protein
MEGRECQEEEEAREGREEGGQKRRMK